MTELNQRQKELLKQIILRYVDAAEPVGSEALAQSTDLGVSPATVRNEMAFLTKEGFLEKPHVSAGRIPTELGFRYYIQNLMQEQEIPVVNEVAIKQRVWANRQDPDQMLRAAVQSLADESQNLSLVVTSQGRVYSAGAAHVLRHPEFYDIDVTRAVLHLLDQADLLLQLFENLPPEQEFGILLGSETGLSGISTCGLVLSRFSLPGSAREKGHLGVLGPVRLEYGKIIPLVRYFGTLMRELTSGW